MSFIVNEWASEVKNYSFEDNICIPHQQCGHYTQVVWANSYKVGCARSLCKDTLNVVCNYGPAGNVENQWPYSAGSPCTGCYSNDSCNNNLCINSKREELKVNVKYDDLFVNMQRDDLVVGLKNDEYEEPIDDDEGMTRITTEETVTQEFRGVVSPRGPSEAAGSGDLHSTVYCLQDCYVVICVLVIFLHLCFA
ncbi:uncharacterized protein O3C94_008681 [Discoglossus pictus]